MKVVRNLFIAAAFIICIDQILVFAVPYGIQSSIGNSYFTNFIGVVVFSGFISTFSSVSVYLQIRSHIKSNNTSLHKFDSAPKKVLFFLANAIIIVPIQLVNPILCIFWEPLNQRHWISWYLTDFITTMMGLFIVSVFSFSKSLQKQEEKLNNSSKSDVAIKQKTSSLKVNNVVVDMQPSDSSRNNLKQDLNDENPMGLSQDKYDKSTITEEEQQQN